ncbi:hypothetical protein BDV41DRAFT_577777 [Aspergillus transmontanensis]|uniref:MACPF-like domain-containing protein n=1 Tax=Aspergillus transmontanensis TaxID=1034304 RepID=A0A5N6VV19_9EURO|nr:hypothetical protein BDV41DRAFT_577777 [Aspergillus transmontanensis]
MLGHKYGGLIQCSSASGFLLKPFSIASQPSLDRLLVLPNMSASGNEQSQIQEAVEEAEKANENDSQALFDVYVYDDRSGQAKMEKFVTLGSFKNVQGTKLSQIRAMLNNENALSFRLQGAPFCNKIGAVANENLPFAEYIKSLDRGGTKSEEKTEQQGYSLIVPTGDAPVTEPHAYAVYFKPRALSAGMDDATKEFLKEKLDLELRKAELKTGDKPDILTSSYNHSSFMAGISKTEVVHPADMTQGQWNIVMETNSLLHASYVRLPSHGSIGKVERSMYPAFKLRPRQFYDFNASLDHKDIAAPMRNLIIPRYRVEDDSYVEVSEKKTSVARAIASSSLSEIAAEAAVGGGCFGYSAGVNAGFKNEEAASTSEAKTENTKQMTITYNFPRVVVQLDEESLQLSDECAEALKHVKDKASLQAFKDKYGTFFATRIELGGRLHATEDSTALAKGEVAEKSKAMKIAAGLSFSSPYVQASVSASSASSNASRDETNKSSLNLGMTWEAKGGDTLLCNNPSAWCATVASFYNWRVVKQENLLSMEDMISRIPECASAKSVFDSIKESKTVAAESSIPVCFRHQQKDRYFRIEDKPSKIIKDLIRNTAKMTPTPTVTKWLEENSKECRSVWLTFGAMGHQVFNVQGVNGTTNSKGRLLNGGSYTICGQTDNTYLQGTSWMPEYGRSFLHDGVKETAWTFNMKSVSSLRKPGTNLEPGDGFHIEICDHEGQSLGLMSSYQVGAGLTYLLGVSENDPVTFTLEYPEK